jgi:putative hydrolase of the HAD superfamily
MTDFHGPDWVEQQEHLKLFDVIAGADLIGVLKPDPRAFRHAAAGLGLPIEQIVFLDNRPGNVAESSPGITAVRVPWEDPGPGHRYRQGTA